MHTYLVGNQLSPDDLGAGVEGELHSNWGKLQLLDGVGLPRLNVNCQNVRIRQKVAPGAEHHWWVHQQGHGSGQ